MEYSINIRQNVRRQYTASSSHLCLVFWSWFHILQFAAGQENNARCSNMLLDNGYITKLAHFKAAFWTLFNSYGEFQNQANLGWDEWDCRVPDQPSSLITRGRWYKENLTAFTVKVTDISRYKVYNSDFLGDEILFGFFSQRA